MKHFLDSDGLMTLYKPEVRQVVEYAPFIWVSSVCCHLNLLNKVERQVERLLICTHLQLSCKRQRQQNNQDDERKEQITPLDSVEHQKSVATVIVLHKVQNVQDRAENHLLGEVNVHHEDCVL